MTDAFATALAFVLRHEGGFVNDPHDPGGMTNLGVTRRTWGDWLGRDATAAEMHALTPAAVAPLYRKRYWDALRCAELHPALALPVFDFGVNAGVGRSARTLQLLVGAQADGVVGDATVRAAAAYVASIGARRAADAFSAAREAYYRQLATFPRYGRGWLARVDDARHAAGALA